jgi:hypothetical protein
MPAYIRYNNTTQQALLDEWVSNLSPQDQSSFFDAEQNNRLLWESYQSQGLITAEPIYEIVHVPEVNETISVPVGEKLVLAPGVTPSQLQMHPDYANWFNALPENLANKVVLQD